MNSFTFKYAVMSNPIFSYAILYEITPIRGEDGIFLLSASQYDVCRRVRLVDDSIIDVEGSNTLSYGEEFNRAFMRAYNDWLANKTISELITD